MELTSSFWLALSVIGGEGMLAQGVVSLPMKR